MPQNFDLRIQEANTCHTQAVGGWAVKYAHVQKPLHCPKQPERYSDIYEDLSTRGENTCQLRELSHFPVIEEVL
jgi:hypothetical protein